MALRRETIIFLLFVGCFAYVWTLPVEETYQYTRQGTRIADADGLFHIYALPVGQGDAHVIQCPNGDLSIVDFGSSDGASGGFWYTSQLTAFIQGKFQNIRSIILTHNDADHYKFISTVLDPTKVDLSGLEHFYASCQEMNLATVVRTWLNAVGREKLVTFNNGLPCGPNGQPCTTIALCPDNPEIQVKVLGANLGQQCNVTNGNNNIDSIVFKVTYGSFSVVLNGDFEDKGSSPTENGPQKAMVNYYGDQLVVTVYKLSHHGAETNANKPITRAAHAPKALFASGNPWYSYQHPRCNVIDGFIQDVQTVCKPEMEDVASPFYCGQRTDLGLPVDSIVQRRYTCGLLGGGLRLVDNNEFAVYTTVPEQCIINLIDLRTNGTGWGFINNYMPRNNTACQTTNNN